MTNWTMMEMLTADRLALKLNGPKKKSSAQSITYNLIKTSETVIQARGITM